MASARKGSRTLGIITLAVVFALSVLVAHASDGHAADAKSGSKTKSGGSSSKTLLDAAKKGGSSSKRSPGSSSGSKKTFPPPSSGKTKSLDVTKKSFMSMEKKGDLTVTSTKRNVEGAAENAALNEVMGSMLVEQLGKSRKRIDKYTESPRVDGKRFRPTAAGNIVTNLKTRDGRSESVVLLGSAFATRDLSETLAEVGTGTSAAADYAVIHDGVSEMLALDPKALGIVLRGMPEPGKLGKKDPTKLIREIIKRWEKNPPSKLPPMGKRDCSESCEKEVPARLLTGGSQASSCYDRSPDGLWAIADWTLKGKSTCVKDQGETRGTGVAFAISAAVEAAVRREHDRCVDLSEQHLHYQQKNHWFPIPPNFGDDLNSPTSVLGMMVGDYEFRMEDQWNYNLSPQRTEVTYKSKEAGIYKGYKNSCVGYGDTPCSDTNHQGSLLCVKGSKECGYAAQILPNKGAIKVLAYNNFFNVNLPGPTAERAPMFLAMGMPVVASFQVTQSFLDAADDGWVRPPSGSKGKKASDELRGWHVAMIEGYVPNRALPKGTAGGAGGGYYVMKNSWGPCVGDGGYWYVPAKWLADHALSMAAITGIYAYGESSVIGIAFNSALPPEIPQFYDAYDDQAFIAGYSSLPWTDANPWSTQYWVCIVSSETGSECSQENGTLFYVPADQGAEKRYRLPASIVYADQYRGKTVTWKVAACNSIGCSWTPGDQNARFALPNANLYMPQPGTTVSRSPTVYWYEVDGATSYKVVVGPSPMPAPYPPTADSAFKKYGAGLGEFSGVGPNGVNQRSFEIPDGDPIPENLGDTVHWYVEACRNIGGNSICSLWPYWENRPHQAHEGVFHFGTLHLEGGTPVGGMTFDEACGIIRDLVDSPRCRNCHNDIVDVTRGNNMDDHGLTAADEDTCSNCHNGQPNHSRPWPGEGPPFWHAPTDSGMHWTDLTPDQIIDRIADPATNGGHDLDFVASHVQTDHLVLWGFDPTGPNGETNGRTAAPHADTYVEAFLVWAGQWEANGESCQ